MENNLSFMGCSARLGSRTARETTNLASPSSRVLLAQGCWGPEAQGVGAHAGAGARSENGGEEMT